MRGGRGRQIACPRGFTGQGKRRRTRNEIKIQNPIIAAQTLLSLKEWVKVIDESKKKAGLPGKKVMGLFSLDFHQRNNKFLLFFNITT